MAVTTCLGCHDCQRHDAVARPQDSGEIPMPPRSVIRRFGIERNLNACGRTPAFGSRRRAGTRPVPGSSPMAVDETPRFSDMSRSSVAQTAKSRNVVPPPSRHKGFLLACEVDACATSPRPAGHRGMIVVNIGSRPCANRRTPARPAREAGRASALSVNQDRLCLSVTLLPRARPFREDHRITPVGASHPKASSALG